jgi:3-dehydroquinate synthase
MLLALDMSARRGWIARSEVGDFRELLRSMHLPVHPPQDMHEDAFLALMSRDKKVVDGHLRLVLLEDIGTACIVDDATEEELRGLLLSARRAGTGHE